MAGFWYFVPGIDKGRFAPGGNLHQTSMRELDIDGVLWDVVKCPEHAIIQDVKRGPDDLAGCIFYPVPMNGKTPRNPGYDQAAQEFRKVRDGSMYLGWLTEEPPTPTDLERRTTIEGHSIADDFGCEWLIPIARAEWNPRGTLPAAFGFDENDEPETGVSPRHRKFWESAGRLYDLIGTATSIHGDGEDAVLSQQFTETDDLFLFGMVRQALAVNYRVGNAELATIEKIRPGWLAATCLRPMVNAICDLEAYRQFWDARKKKVSRSGDGGLTSLDGIPAETQTTALA